MFPPDPLHNKGVSSSSELQLCNTPAGASWPEKSHALRDTPLVLVGFIDPSVIFFVCQGRSLVHLAATSETLVPLEFVHRRLLMNVAFEEARKIRPQQFSAVAVVVVIC